VPWLEAPKSSLPPSSPPAAAPQAVRQAPPASSGTSTGRTLAYFAGGIGVGGVLAGAITGVLALREKTNIDENCPQRRCNAAGHDAVESARTAATVSTIGFSVGLAGAVGATILWLSSDRPKRSDEANGTVRPMVIGTERGAAFGVGGTFR
jgi:hypothetical protein